MTSLADKIPTLNEADLKALRANAARLVEHGSAVQVTTAADILPLIDARLAEIASAPKPVVVRKRAAPKKKLAPVTGHQTALPDTTA
ncbi:hypothetical protein [Brevundimonas sp. P7753]|jgi:hypothetical protein|uniref:hypothetical protein n=1 Tax=Brevundimonas TaxID=41275 RepID=UPI0015BCCC31|nr:hypothetical protein [Brevundimonas sp. P7753]MBD3834735.1 hypothetical protein [Brevundimonas sp.]NWE54401.1 hypothetical protein [Brevundimonas sp. P7753]